MRERPDGPGRVRVDETPSSLLEHLNDATVGVTCAAICGSDLHLYRLQQRQINSTVSRGGGSYAGLG
jgi:threonine dehydrogenase-like Zn-dependent dehydrogenase